MTVLAVGSIQSINYNAAVTSAGTYYVVVGYAGLIPSNPISGSATVANIPGYVGAAGLKEAIQDAIKADLITNHAYTFAADDTVKVFGV